MENYQKVDQIVNSTGCSYEDAKTALENCEWDMIDAVISLEKDGKIKKAEEPEQKAEEAVEIIPEVASEKTYDAGQGTADNTAGDQGSTGNAGYAESAEKAKKRVGGFFKSIKRILFNNRMVVFRRNGQVLLNVPIFAPVIALIACFWSTLIIAGIAMVFGYRFHFEGEDLGKTNINNTMDKATDYAEKVKNDLTGKAKSNEQNTDN